jgi:tetratricopeptide (TPR) repeat protein
MKRTTRLLEQLSSCVGFSKRAEVGLVQETSPAGTTPSVRIWKSTVLVPAIASLILITSLTGCAKLMARDNINKGVEAFKSGKYDEAISHFQKATQLDPSLEMGHTYLATAYAQNIVPGSDSADNKRNADLAINAYKEVLARDPKDVNATKGIASIYFNTNQFDLAKQWQRKVLDIDPNDPEAMYTIAVIDWTASRKNTVKLLTDMGSTYKADGDPQIPKPKCIELAKTNVPLNTEALQYLNKAVEIRPSYDDAMAYLSLEYLEKAVSDCGDDAARKADLATAHEWVEKNMSTRKANEAKALQAAPGGVKMDN